MRIETVEIVVSVTGKIPRRQFENYSPFYSVKESIKLNDGEVFTDSDRIVRQRMLQMQLENIFNQDRERIQLDELQSLYKSFDFIPNPADGKKYPRVSDILYWDAEFYISPDELAQYASRGTAIHQLAWHWWESGATKGGEWGPYKKVIGKRDLILLETGSLKLFNTLDDFKFVDFMKKHGADIVWECGEFRAFNSAYFYCGQPDYVGKWKGKKAIFDIKSRACQDSDFKQMAAYTQLDDARLADIEVMVCIPLNPKNKCGFGEPVVVEGKEEIQKYFNQFLRDREEFKDKFKI